MRNRAHLSGSICSILARVGLARLTQAMGKMQNAMTCTMAQWHNSTMAQSTSSTQRTESDKLTCFDLWSVAAHRTIPPCRATCNATAVSDPLPLWLPVDKDSLSATAPSPAHVVLYGGTNLPQHHGNLGWWSLGSAYFCILYQVRWVRTVLSQQPHPNARARAGVLFQPSQPPCSATCRR